MFSKKQSIMAISMLILSTAPLTLSSRAQAQTSIEINSNNFDKEILQSSLPVILKVSATWCPPCQRLKPLFEQIAQKFQSQLTFASMDYDSNLNFVTKHNIESVPTFMIYNKGKLITKQPGSPASLQYLEKFVLDVLKLVENN